ncbi:FG-GAP-like repeat-containing protein [Streptomyces sp. UNOB3_S3]|uniref:FG-GAP-like repeat-containing protein n=1 Tax=Streptomyces sp. UNOB3_S3 TaxID=2871682 RepID=UPI001E63A964|nr:FG-GAP-like repeat-containing protein [Streptomyces sp. UNOB3_S3]MCC3779060.1 VCBS repeat-containing protein [Streptomyces sp. UNOB3_S3]
MARHFRTRLTRTRLRRSLVTAVVAALCAAAVPLLAAPGAAAGAGSSWTRTWGTAMGTAGPASRTGVAGRQTLRMVVHTSVAGSAARIQLVNTFSREPVTIGHATLARRARGAGAAAAPVTLTFGGGGRSTVIRPGGSVLSDPAAFPVKADENLLVSVHLPQPVRTAPFHAYTLTTSYASAPGDAADHAGDTAGGGFPTRFPFWAFLGGVDVRAPHSGGTVVLLGDSQTDGGHTTPDTDRRLPDDYARALQARPRPMGVVNAGISANHLLRGTEPAESGQSALLRFDRDVLAQPDVRSVVLFEGVNDILFADAGSAELVAGIRQLAARAHAAGLTFAAATIPPFRGYENAWTPARERVRQQVNAYLRTTRDIDSAVDFDEAARDPLDPTRLFAAYYNRGGDRLHFGDNGSQALSDTLLPAPVPPRVSLDFTQTTAGDVTGDGIPDVIAADRKHDLYLWPGNTDVDDARHGDGTLAARPRRLTGGWEFTQTVAADFTGDGRTDLIAKDASDTLHLWPGNGDGTFGRPRPLTGGWRFTQTTAGDVTGDGVPDLVAAGADGVLRVWPGEGDGTFGRPRRLMGGWRFTGTRAGDFTGDGRTDLVAVDRRGVLLLWAGEGHGTFARPRAIADARRLSEITPLALRTGGIAHLMARDDATGVLKEWRNTGNAALGRPLRLTGGW